MLNNPASGIKSTKIGMRWSQGIVVNNNDPKNYQRVRIRCAELHRGLADDELPWAQQFNPGAQGNTTTMGKLEVPVVGSFCWYMYLDETPYNPVYMSGRSVGSTKIEELVSEDYPHVLAGIDRSGNLFWVNTEKDHVRYQFVSGAEVSVDGAGHIKIIAADQIVGPNGTSINPAGLTVELQGNFHVSMTGNNKIEASGTTDILSNGKTNVHSQAECNISAPVTFINSNAPTAPVSPSAPTARTRPAEPGFSGKTDY